ncbi:peptide synthetase [Bacillus mangrovi]|uniref:Peptide synthetase n=1 Tax=Metabacillus mangrovi TaxID=1491830 RepID=A0A7X2S4X4_9BACI|nr:peptide synthetase [Metabacillus mangrovi]MTH53687.1 peptide synthetase [Metabacillus mangrovi]
MTQVFDRTADQYLRPLGAFERIIDLYMHRNPVQFSLAAVLARDVSERELTQALQKLQRVHPLLAAEVRRPDQENHRAIGAVFHSSGREIPVRIAREMTWEREAAYEQTTPIKSSPGPLARAVLIPAGNGLAGATIVMTFAHQITDGRGALRAIQDLAAILAGESLLPSDLPMAQEDLLASPAPTAATVESAAQKPAEPAGEQEAILSPPGRLRPFDGTIPHIQAKDLGAADTNQLIERSRAESCTVQAALCAAAALVLVKAMKREQVRINVPIDLRQAAGPEDVVVRFAATMVVLDHSTGSGFWDLARSAAAQLKAARNPETIRDSALMLAQLSPSTADDAELAMLAATNADIEITNLGVTTGIAEEGDVLAVWGPTMTTQVAGEQILGVVTHGAVLRMVNVTHDPIAGLVEKISLELEAACR